MTTVHYSDWSSQPEVRIACTQTSSIPAWAQPRRVDVYLLEDGRYYTFNKHVVDCAACIALVSP